MDALCHHLQYMHAQKDPEAMVYTQKYEVVGLEVVG
jgi:hypothetical protein